MVNGDRSALADLCPIWILVAVLLAMCAPAFAQGAGILPDREARESDRDNPLQREAWFRRGRTVKGKSAAALFYRAYQQKMKLRAARLTRGAATMAPFGAGSGWSPLGPTQFSSQSNGASQDYGFVSGRVTAVAVDPSDTTGNTVYVGGAYGGVWKSTNAGNSDPNTVTWTSLTDDQATLATGTIAVQPGNNQLILVGTGEPNASGDSYYGLGILRSTDGGASWALIRFADSGGTPFQGIGFSKIAFSTDNPSLVVASASQFALFPSSQSKFPGLYWSTDAGLSWHTANVQDGTTPILQQAVSDVTYNSVNHTFYSAMAFHGFYSSTDGVNWTRLVRQPGAGLSVAACPANALSTCPIIRGEIAVRPGSVNEMYAFYVSVDFTTFQFPDRGVFKSTDGGGSWQAIPIAGITNCGDQFGCGTNDQGIYDLALAAVPNGSGTDLYAGAINLYKCSITSANPTCAATPFLNLTHVYGCSPVAWVSHVHPDQHAIGFAITGGRSLIYFGHDGGVSRAFDGYQLRSGSCAVANPFDNLNASLGSLTQFMWFSQHPTDSSTVMGGTQDNGSPATSSGMNQAWVTVNFGDGGFNDINPNNPVDWFTANTGVSIQRCLSGINCRAPDFQNHTVVQESTLGGDQGSFYTPYMLDPQAHTRMIVGTCRVWRGSSDGTGFSARSFNFDTGTNAACTGGEDNMISALATGGVPATTGGSAVIYAGTSAGNVFVSTNPPAGPSTWTNRNPSGLNFQISGIAIDPADTTGRTAYASVMGFGVGHVWKTTNAGQAWTNIDGDLPDAPADAVLVDPDDNTTVYVGTDVGVFVTQNGGVNWTEVGLTTTPGKIPNVPVVRLAMFESAGVKLLRAATHGRGIWEFVLAAPPPDFKITIPTPSITLFPNQTSNFTGTLKATFGYNSQVTISCDPAATAVPSTCTGTTATPTPGGVAFSVNAGNNAAGDFNFNVKGLGADTNSTTHLSPVTLHVIDFGLGAPSPAAMTVNSGSLSNPVSLQVTGGGSFSGTVALTCVGLPAGATCNFAPSSSVQPTSSSPVNVTLTLSTQSSMAASSSSFTVRANTSGAPAAKSQTISLTVTTNPDYSVSASPTTVTSVAGGSPKFALTFTPVHSYAGMVNVSCSTSLSGASCGASPTAANLSGGAASSTITVAIPGGATPGTYPVSVVSSDATSGSPAHNLSLSLVVVPDFSLTAPGNTATVTRGQTAQFSVAVAGVSGAFNTAISFSCSGLPAQTSCAFTPASVTPGSGTSTATLRVSTTAAVASAPLPPPIPGEYPLGVPLSAFALVFAGLFRSNSKRRIVAGCAGLGVVLVLVLILASCGGGGSSGGNNTPPPGNPGTLAGTYAVTVAATSGSISHSVPVTLTVQ